jgi:hypothetical protein
MTRKAGRQLAGPAGVGDGRVDVRALIYTLYTPCIYLIYALHMPYIYFIYTLYIPYIYLTYAVYLQLAGPAGVRDGRGNVVRLGEEARAAGARVPPR